MEALLIMLRNVLVFVALALPGFILVKTKIIGGKESGALSKLLTYVGMPFLILSSTLNVSFSGEFIGSIVLIGVKFGALFTGWRMYFVSAMKLVAFPALGVGILFALKLALTIDENMIIGFFIALAMPTAGLASTFSDQHDGDTQNAVVFTLGTTILSILTIPVFYWLLNVLL